MDDEIIHKYFIENDIILMSGEDAIKILSSSPGNCVAFDYNSIVEIAKSPKPSSDKLAAEDFLKNLNNYTKNNALINKIEENKIILENNSTIEFLEDKIYSTEYIHLTKDPITELDLKRKGIKHENARFLTYGSEIFEKGLLELDFVKGKSPKTIMSLEDIADFDKEILFNNQIIKINNSLYYQLYQDLKSNKEETRYFSNNENFKLRKLDNLNYAWNKYIKFSGNFNPRGTEQELAVMNASDPNIEVSFIVGGSGSGKTLCALIGAFNLILGQEEHRTVKGGVKDRIVLFKPNDILGGKSREMGYIPGDKDEKMWPIMRSYEDAFKCVDSIKFTDLLKTTKPDNAKFGTKYFLPLKHPAIEIDNLIWGRGRTFENCVVMIDEAQNYTPYEIQQLIERGGLGSKYFIIGDIHQIDNPKLSENYNGLTYAASIFAKEPHPRMSINLLKKNLRSQSAQIMREYRAPRDL